MPWQPTRPRRRRRPAPLLSPPCQPTRPRRLRRPAPLPSPQALATLDPLTPPNRCHVRLRGRKENQVESANLGSCCLNCSSGRPACGEQNGGSGQRSARRAARAPHCRLADGRELIRQGKIKGGLATDENDFSIWP